MCLLIFQEEANLQFFFFGPHEGGKPSSNMQQDNAQSSQDERLQTSTVVPQPLATVSQPSAAVPQSSGAAPEYRHNYQKVSNIPNTDYCTRIKSSCQHVHAE